MKLRYTNLKGRKVVRDVRSIYPINPVGSPIHYRLVNLSILRTPVRIDDANVYRGSMWKVVGHNPEIID